MIVGNREKKSKKYYFHNSERVLGWFIGAYIFEVKYIVWHMTLLLKKSCFTISNYQKKFICINYQYITQYSIPNFEYFSSKKPFWIVRMAIVSKKTLLRISNYRKWFICIKYINNMSHIILYFKYFSPKGPLQNCENCNFSKKIISILF